ncbi:MAG TPA: translocation/assembly module TamB domain-containing protein, partial [Bacteroidales bacterium]|nr:translocation/assembly module TamB domain-containing protein [Bacteroidales bacterium]
DISKSRTTTDDIAYFAPKLKDFHFNAEISGKVTGKINGLRGRDLNIKFGNNSYLSGNADINGLPDIQTSFLYLDIHKFYSTPADLQRIKIPGSPDGRIHLPEVIRKLDYLSYTGKFSGFINDFVAYGTISCNLGKISSDLSIKPDSSNSFAFRGKIKTKDFNLGSLLDRNDFGKISLNAMVNGRNNIDNKLTAKMNGEIYSFYLRKYNYKNIKINGTISGKTYDGSMTVSDPNVDLSFLGKVNLSTETPEFNFTAEVKRANLYKLNLDTTDTASFISFYATADVTGKNIDNLNGEVKLWNSTLKKSKKEIHINDFLLFTKNIDETKRIILRSDLADAELWGTYQFTQLPQTFKWFLKHYLPSVVQRNISQEKSTLNNFSFEVEFKDTRLLTDFFVPGLYISRDSKLTGTYNPFASDITFNLTIPFMNLQGKKIYDIAIDGTSSREALNFTTSCSSLKINNQLSLDNFTLMAEASNDSVKIVNRWNNWDSVAYKGNILSYITFTPSQKQLFPTVNISMAPSQIVLHDTLWRINPSVFTIDSNRISVNHLEVQYNNQKIVTEGAISRIPDDKLKVSCTNVDLSVVNPFIPGDNIVLAGVVNGEAELSNLYNDPYFHSNIKVDSLKMNRETIGNTEVLAQWDNSNKSINMNLTALRGSLKTLEAEGIYQTKTKNLDGTIHLNKLKANIFQPFASYLISDLKGLATGDLEVHGTIKEPVFNGEVNAQKVSFLINYLKTRYSFSKTIKIKNNNIIINNVVLYDSKGNKSELNGKITHKYFKNFYFDLTLKADNFEFLNTTEKDNSLFYGKAYATGTVDIFGPPKSLTMNINAKTEKNSILAIPLGNRETDVSEMRFVRFIDKTPKIVTPEYDYEKEQKKKDYTINLNGLKLNINLDVTPDATAQIIFDSKIGDMIQGNGYGTIKMEINTQGKFGMYGNFRIEQGDYLFTLQNVINKHFKVSQGGTISWNGNPTDASINIEAIYPARASLYDLLYPIMSTGAEEYKNRIPINCKILLTGKLMNPEPKFEINLPNSTAEVQTMVNSAISNQDELNKQFISLLVLGSFLPDQNMAKTNSENDAANSSGLNPVGSTGMEFLSNQLSRWLSQINQDFDIGVNYRPGTELTSQELEVALSTQLLNDKVSINGNFDVGGTSTKEVTNNTNNTNNIVGDFEVDYKPWDSGKVRFKAFNRSNESFYELSPYTQGIGISYKEDFNSFSELIKRYWNGIFAKKEEEIKPKVEKESSQVVEQE